MSDVTLAKAADKLIAGAGFLVRLAVCAGICTAIAIIVARSMGVAI